MPARTPHPLPTSPTSASDESTPRYRTGAVGRMVRMPVETLRVWERRYRVTAPATTETGHRLYSAADVRRLALLKQLTDVGHAIGTIAALDMDQLRQVAATHGGALAGQKAAPAQLPVPWRVAVVGAALARRLQRPSVLRRLGRPTDVAGPFASLEQVGEMQAGTRVDVLLVQMPGLHEACLSGLQSAADALGARKVAVLYSYAAQSVCDALTAAGVELLREPQAERALAIWLRGLCEPASQPVDRPPALPPVIDPALMVAGPVATRRYDDATLADFASLSTTVACECPRHVAELLMQLSHFEAYSAECAHRSPADGLLHDYLRQVAAASRALFETALEQVALHEGLVLAA